MKLHVEFFKDPIQKLPMRSIKFESLGVIKAPQVFQYTALFIGLMHDLSKPGSNNESV